MDIRLHAVQANFIVGDIGGNMTKIGDYVESVVAADSRTTHLMGSSTTHLIVTSELAVCGYAPQDMLLRDGFIEECERAVMALAKIVPANVYVLLGGPTFTPDRGKLGQKRLQNVAYLLNGGRVVRTFAKTLLPTYNIFDEYRYFEPNVDPASNIFYIGGHAFGVTVCEDIWNEGFARDQDALYNVRPVEELRRNGAKFIVNLSASPYCLGRETSRLDMIKDICSTYGLDMLYVNQVGANDSLVFDGRSVLVHNGHVNQFAAFEEESGVLGTVCISRDHVEYRSLGSEQPALGEMANLRKTLVLGVRDYMHKQGFKKAIIGMSGGIDSALTVAVAVEALGAENVIGVTMPTKYNLDETKNDARLQAERLGITFFEIPIESMRVDFTTNILGNTTGADAFSQKPTNENLQARIRGMILMALSNDIPGAIVLSTGNKSEMSMGYATLYGDMCGGLSVLGDVYKTQVFDLSRHFNEVYGTGWIPESVINRPPSAELSEGQKDEDTLPPYSVLDEVLKVVIDRDGNYDSADLSRISDAIDAYIAMVIAALHSDGCEDDVEGEIRPYIIRVLGSYDSVPKMIDFITKKVMKNEFKRRQSAPCIRVNPRPWNVGWRRPIVAKY